MRSARALWLAAISLPLLAFVAARSEAQRPITVSYVSATSVYLDGGRAEGVREGDRYRLARVGAEVAELEVAFVAEHSASCRVLKQLLTIRTGDVAEKIAAGGGEPAGPTPAPTPTPSSPPSTTGATAAPPVKPAAVTARPQRFARLSGSLSVSTEEFHSNDATTLGWDDVASRLSLHARQIGGAPLRFDVRIRADRQSLLDVPSSLDATRRTNRFYEGSLTYDPPGGRLAFQLGRVAASPWIGVPYLDGAIGQVRLTRHFYTGLFAGKRPELDNLSFQSSGQRYGLFVRFDDQPTDRPRYAEAAISFVGDYLDGHQLDREYVAIESRFGNGPRWSLYERAEIDWNRSYRLQIAGSRAQLSTVVVASSWQLASLARLSLAYDRHQTVPTADTQRQPEDVFLDLLSDGGSATLYLGRGSGLNASITAGVRRENASRLPAGVVAPEGTQSYGLSIADNNLGSWHVMVGVDGQLYRGGAVEGNLIMLRAHKVLPGGHDIGLLLGRSLVRNPAFALDDTSQWARLTATVELPLHLYALGEAEVGRGPLVGGRRGLLELGYRFW